MNARFTNCSRCGRPLKDEERRGSGSRAQLFATVEVYCQDCGRALFAELTSEHQRDPERTPAATA